MLPPEPNEPAGNPRTKAQELAERALQARTRTDAAALARQALELDGECTDAQVVLARESARTGKERVAQLKLILERAEARLGSPFLRDHRGGLWDIPEARPALRARLALAAALEAAGKPAQAAPHLEELLKADDTDALGARFHLIRCLLLARDGKALVSSLKRWEGEASAFMAWAALLERVHARAEAGAVKALARARSINPHFEAFLTGRAKLPRHIPDRPAPGSPEEAAQALRLLGGAWLNDREGMYWLFRHE